MEVCPALYHGDRPHSQLGVGLLWLSSEEAGAAELRGNSDSCCNVEGPLTPINFCESGFLCDSLKYYTAYFPVASGYHEVNQVSLDGAGPDLCVSSIHYPGNQREATATERHRASQRPLV